MRYRLAALLEKRGSYQEALSLYQRVIEETPEAPEAELALLKAGQILLSKLHCPDHAAAHFERFLRNYPFSDWTSFAASGLEQARRARQPDPTEDSQ